MMFTPVGLFDIQTIAQPFKNTSAVRLQTKTDKRLLQNKQNGLGWNY